MSQSDRLPLEQFSILIVPANPEPFRLLNRVPIHENGEPLVDLRERNPELIFAEKCLPYVRGTVSGMLKEATSLLPEGRKLRVSTGLRTLEMQSEMYWSNYNRLKQENPHWPVNIVRRQTNRFWAAPDVKAPPGHCTGGAVDVNICDATGEALDHSSPHERWKGAPTAVSGLTDEAAANRRLLCYIMHSAGFSNCRDEFWHWSYGDSAWAVRIGRPKALYGLAPAPEGAYPVPAAEPATTEQTRPE